MKPLWPYQERAIKEAISRKRNMEAIGMGLGKTRVMLEVCQRQGMQALVVAPLRVALFTWPAQIKEWMPEFTYDILHGPDKNLLYKSKRNVDVKIINYDGLKWLLKQIETYGSLNLKGRILILDESTQIKNSSSARFKSLSKILHFFPQVYCLSGTPMPNGYLDLWAQYAVIDYGKALGRYKTHYLRDYFDPSPYCQWVHTLKPGAAETIQNKVQHITTVLRPEDHLDLPELVTDVVEVDLGKDVMTLYKDMKKEFVLELGEHTVTALTPATVPMKLRQITQGALYVDERGNYETLGRAKLEALTDFVERANGDPILCPIQFKFELAEIRKALGYRVPAIVGGVPIDEQRGILDKWNAGALPLLLCHPAALSHGLNLQGGGRLVCWYSLTWDLEQYHQLNGRLHRQGQTQSVYITHIVAKNTIDEKVSMVLKQKEATQSDFLNAIKGYFTGP